MSAHRSRLDQFDEGNPASGHASAMEAVLPTASAASMTSRRCPAPWRAERMGWRLLRPGREPAGARGLARDLESGLVRVREEE
jgi:hypothetical protein